MMDGLLVESLIVSPQTIPPRQTTPRRRFWTNREIRILTETYPVHGLGGCMELIPDRTDRAIYQQVIKLGLRAPKTKGPRREWRSSEAIDGVIRRCYQGEVKSGMVNDCARALGRPRWWISHRAKQLGFVAPRFKEPAWSAEEDAVLESYSWRASSTIQKILKRRGFARTETAIHVRRKRLGLAVKDPDRYTAHELAGIMGVDGKTVTRWIALKILRAERRGTARVEAQGGDEWLIHRRDVRGFIIDNAAAVDIRKVDKFWFIDLLADRMGES